MNRLENLYFSVFGQYPQEIKPLLGAGSNRKYFRLIGPAIVIGTIGESRQENEAFIYFSNLFSSKNLPVPKVIAVSDDRMCYLQEDVGDVSLYSLIQSNGGQSAEIEEHLQNLMTLLPRFHYGSYDHFDGTRCYPRHIMDRRAVMWDLNYFKYSFLKTTGLDFDENLLENEFEILANKLIENPDSTIILRDCQSRNIMLKDSKLSVIDFQGARLGDGLYDVASMLWQARAGFSVEQRMKYAEVYRKSAEELTGKKMVGFYERLAIMVLFRLLQVLGAYGYRGLFERKAMFLEVIPSALKSACDAVNWLQTLIPNFLPYLSSLLLKIASLPRFASIEKADKLTVTVMSFSYKKGLPEDLSGNGGGFVFDCRAMHNPGRYQEYKNLTGRDTPVIEFLENRGEIAVFLESCYALVDASVERYIERGFTSLSVSFGCTGGQHRSVYCAEHLAHHIHEKFGVPVRLTHREQSISEYFSAK